MANDYISAMNDAEYLGADTWRLPIEKPLNGIAFVDGPVADDGTTDHGQGLPNGWIGSDGAPVSELGHMYYVNLGLPLDPEIWSAGGTEFGIIRYTEPIISLEDGRYYSSTIYPFDEDFVWGLDMLGGRRTFAWKDSTGNFVWPVADGDVFSDSIDPVPIPAAVWLFGSAIAGFGLCRKRKAA
jgi:hypothetical protein